MPLSDITSYIVVSQTKIVKRGSFVLVVNSYCKMHLAKSCFLCNCAILNNNKQQVKNERNYSITLKKRKMLLWWMCLRFFFLQYFGLWMSTMQSVYVHYLLNFFQFIDIFMITDENRSWIFIGRYMDKVEEWSGFTRVIIFFFYEILRIFLTEFSADEFCRKNFEFATEIHIFASIKQNPIVLNNS